MNHHRSLLLLSCVVLGAACVPKLEGAPCRADDDCPNGKACVSGFCQAGSGMGGGSGGGGTGGGEGTTGGGGGTTADGGALLPQTYELTSAGARMHGGTVTLDLEVGHTTPRTKMTHGTLELTGAAAVQR
jgi:hypothetical protein